MNQVIVVRRCEIGRLLEPYFYPLSSSDDREVVCAEILRDFVKYKYIDPIEAMVESVSALRRVHSCSQATADSFDQLFTAVKDEVVRHDKMNINMESVHKVVAGESGRVIANLDNYYGRNEDEQWNTLVQFNSNVKDDDKIVEYVGDFGSFDERHLRGRRRYVTIPATNWQVLQQFVQLEGGEISIIKSGVNVESKDGAINYE